MTDLSATQNTYPYQNEPTWSRSEKVIARKVFDAALKRELEEIMREAKQMASQIKEPADMWELERFLTHCRKDIDRKYDSRASRLMWVLATLSCERRIRDEDLHGLGKDKLKAIRSSAKILAEYAA